MAIATLTIDIVAKLAELQSGFDRAAQIAERNSKRIDAAFATLKTTLGALGLGALIRTAFGGFDAAIDKLDALSERAQSFALPADFLSALDLTAKASGIDDIDKALAKFTATLTDAAGGSRQAEAVVRALGISVEGLRDGTISVEQALRRSADAVRGYADGFEKGNLVQAAFGAKNQRLIALLNEGAEGLDRFGGVSRERIEDAAKLANEIDRLSASWDRLKLSISGALAGRINRFFDPEQVNDDARVVERLTAQIANLKKALGGRLNDEVRRSVELELADLEQRAAALSRAGLDRFIAGNAAVRAGEEKPRAPNVKLNTEGDSFLDSLRKRVQLQEQGEFAALRLEAAQKRVAAAAEPFVRKLERIKDLQDSITLFLRDQQRIEQQRDEEQAFDRGLVQRLQDLRLEGELIGKSALEQARLNAEREIALQLDARLRQAGDDRGAISRALDSADRARAEMSRMLESNAVRAQRQAIEELLRDIEDETRLVGANTAERQRAVLLRALEKSGIGETADAYAELIDRINQVARAVAIEDEVRRQQQAFDDLGQSIATSAENAIVKWEGVRKLLGSIEQDIIRIVTRNLVTEPLSNALTKLLKGAAGGSVGNAFGDLGGFFARLFGPSLVGVFASGTDYVPRTGLAMVHQGERIIPAARNRAGATTTYITVNVDGSTTRETANQVAAAVARRLTLVRSRAF